MKTSIAVLLGLIVAISIGSSAATISCYVGTYTDVFSTSMVGITQQTGCTACEKSVSTVSVLGYSTTTSIATCVATCSSGSTSVLGVSYSNYCCTTNLCNGATTQSISRVGLLLGTVTALALALVRSLQ